MKKQTQKQIQKQKQIIKEKPKPHVVAKKFNYWPVIMALVVMSATFLLYFPVIHFDFVNWDDDRYVIDNPYIKQLNWGNIRYFFTNFYFLMYLPITLLSYTIEYHFVRLDPWLYHLTSMIFHVINTGLVYLFIYKLVNLLGIKQKLEYAVIIAALFGLHTLHIESVAWIGERKDVLYTCFYFVTLILYLKYLEKPKIIILVIAIITFIISLISKAQAMPLSIVLILIDFVLGRKLLTKKVIIEKIPFLILSIAFGLIAVIGTRSKGLVSSTQYSWFERAIYASYGFVTYIVKLIVPYKLSVIYPYPEDSQTAVPFMYWLYLAPLAGIILSFFIALKKNKLIAFGLAFFTVNIFIVLQIFAYHNFLMADRYSYVSSIGIFFIIAYFLVWITERKPALKYYLIIIFIAYLGFLTVYTHTHLKVWEDSITLWKDVRSKYPEVLVAYYNGGNAKAAVGDKEMSKGNSKQGMLYYNDAIEDYNLAIQYKPKYIDALSNRGITLAKIGKVQEALSDFDQVAEIDLSYNNVYSNRGNAKALLGDEKGALQDYNKALIINPDYTDALFNRAIVLNTLRNYQQAYDDFTKILKLQPNYYNVYHNRGMSLSNMGKYDEALADFDNALKQDPNNVDAYFNRGVTRILLKNYQLSIIDFDIVIKMRPDLALPYLERGIAKISLGNKDGGCQDLQTASKLGSPQAKSEIERNCLK